MRILGILAGLLLVPLTASAQTGSSFFEGFGGLRTETLPAVSGTLGGTFGVSLTPGVQAIGEFGRTSDVLPSTIATVDYFLPVGVHVSAFYGEGGVRFLTNPRGHVSGYGEALGGVARLSTSVSGISGTADDLINLGLGFLNTTEGTAGVGGGIVFQGGSMVATVGYRFNRIFASDALGGLLSNGGYLDTNEVRVGIGVRF